MNVNLSHLAGQKYNENVNEKRRLIQAGLDYYTNEFIKCGYEKIFNATKIPKQSTNVFETDIKRRLMLDPVTKQLLVIEYDDLIRGYIYVDENGKKSTNIKDRKVNVNSKMGITVVDLINGPTRNEYWAKKYGRDTLPMRFQQAFEQAVVFAIKQEIEMMNGPDKDKWAKLTNEEERELARQKISKKEWVEKFNKLYPNKKIWDQAIAKYKKKNAVPTTQTIYHFNRRWGSGATRGKFIIELDWAGEPRKNKSGYRYDHHLNSYNQAGHTYGGANKNHYYKY